GPVDRSAAARAAILCRTGAARPTKAAISTRCVSSRPHPGKSKRHAGLRGTTSLHARTEHPLIHIVTGLLNNTLEASRIACFYPTMSTVRIEIRRAKSSDAGAVAETHDEAWRAAYQGVIPAIELEKLIMRRGPDWWDSAIRKGSRIAIL